MKRFVLAAFALFALCCQASAQLCSGSIPGGYFLISDTNPTTQVFRGSDATYITNTNAAFQTWLGSNQTCVVPGSQISALANNGSGLYRLTVSSTANLATGQNWQVRDTGTTADGRWIITVIDGTHVDLQGSTFAANSYASGAGLYGPAIVATNVAMFANINTYNAALYQSQPAYQDLGAVGTTQTFTNVAPRWTDISGTADAVTIVLPPVSIAGGPPTGLQLYINNTGGTYRLQVQTALGANLCYPSGGQTAVLTFKSQVAGTWSCAVNSRMSGDGSVVGYIQPSSVKGDLLVGNYGSSNSLGWVSLNTTGLSAPGTNGQLLLGQTSTYPGWFSMGGDATLGASGTLTIAANAITLAKLATQATNTVLGNATSGTAVPTALAVGTCSTAASALIWTTNTGFGCNTSITANAVAVGGITGLGTGVATALAVNVGSAGAFVTNGGALGSPSSVGTLPAYTLGGTVSGGGNQINNVIIGASTPLAGAFTTATASTSVTSPIIAGGSASGSTLVIESTSGAGTTDTITFKTGSQVARHTILSSGFHGFGTETNPQAQFTFSNNVTTGIDPVAGNDQVRFIAADGSNATMGFVSYGNGSAPSSGTLTGYAIGGTAASPSATPANSLFFQIQAFGHANGAYVSSSKAKINIAAVNLWSSTDNSTQMTFQTTPTGSTTRATAMTIQASGGISIGVATDPGIGGIQVNGQTFVPNAAADTATADSTACIATTGGKLLKGTGALGICLGTSGVQFKTAFAPMQAGLAEIVKINLQNYRYLPGYGDSGARVMYGPTAQNVEAVLPDLAGHDVNGETINYDSGALFFIGLRAIQELKADNDNLRAELNTIKRAIAR